MMLPSHADDGAANAILVVLRYRCRVILAMALSRRLGRGVMSMSSHAGDDFVESRKRWHYRGELVVE
jgi:hypothetical protein